MLIFLEIACDPIHISGVGHLGEGMDGVAKIMADLTGPIHIFLQGLILLELKLKKVCMLLLAVLFGQNIGKSVENGIDKKEH